MSLTRKQLQNNYVIIGFEPKDIVQGPNTLAVAVAVWSIKIEVVRLPCVLSRLSGEGHPFHWLPSKPATRDGRAAARRIEECSSRIRPCRPDSLRGTRAPSEQNRLHKRPPEEETRVSDAKPVAGMAGFSLKAWGLTYRRKRSICVVGTPHNKMTPAQRSGALSQFLDKQRPL